MTDSERQTRGICVQSVLAKWYCGCLSTRLEMELREMCERDKSWDDVHTFGFEEGKSATEISTAIRGHGSGGKRMEASAWIHHMLNGCETGL